VTRPGEAGRILRLHLAVRRAGWTTRGSVDCAQSARALNEQKQRRQVCYFRALKIGAASKVAPVDKFSLVLVAVFAVVFLGERPSLREWGGIGLVAAGVVVLALKR
jgi:hypothetical protein